MTPAVAAASSTLSALNAMPTVAAVGVLCVAAVVEIVALPAVLLPGGTVTFLAGALIGTGRQELAVAIPVAIAVIGGDQLAYFTGAAVTRWWRRRRPGRQRPIRSGPLAAWFAAAMPSLAAAAGLSYRSFAVRALTMRLPWLTGALGAGTLAASSIEHLGHVLGIITVIISGVVIAGLLTARYRPGSVRALARGKRPSAAVRENEDEPREARRRACRR